MQLTKKQIDYCMECGVCTGSCPISRVVDNFSPRQMVKRAMTDPENNLINGKEIWSCLSCSRCSARCPVDINFPELNRSLREEARKKGCMPQESHHGIFQAIADIQTRDIKQNRIAWAEKAGQFKDKGEYFYFVGCLPFFDITFRYLDLNCIESAESVLFVLNKMGIEPVISNDERCCGHDAFWSGNMETFKKLAQQNIETIEATGAKKVLFSCPEGYFTFKHHYAEHFGEMPFESFHLTEFLAEELPKSGISFKNADEDIITFHDPCRLGRLSGIYEPPRDLLNRIPGTEIIEMERNRENAVCCGTSAWMECSSCSKSMQIERFNEVVRTGSKAIVTACPKCRIHMTCAKQNTDIHIEVTDIYTYIADRIN